MSILLHTLRYQVGPQRILDDVTLHVRDGDCYGFLGHNGAGKTTALRIALGLLRARSGRVIIDGFDAAEHPREARARTGGLIEVPGFHAGLGGAKNLFMLARLRGLDRRAARKEVDRVLAAVSLEREGTKRVRAYSQGMRQRLGVAQAMLGGVSHVLLDEPMNGLDPEGMEELRATLHDLTRNAGVTVLLSSHQLDEIEGLCNRIGILRRGRLLLEEPVERLRRG
ncbi:MAG: ABC transporter ATP-binding protein, partial [Planctomycetes bacterium]|nr:ABC transporter ATP-binding protein [Planctomycetota bacterium]